MNETLAAGALGAVLFAATNIDDLFLLLAFFADPRYRRAEIWAGQYLGFSVLVAASMALAMGAVRFDPGLVHWLGLVPIAIGAWQLLALVRGRADPDSPGIPQREETGNIVTVATVTLVNGGDNLAIYAPVFVSLAGPQRVVVFAVFAVATAAWLLAAQALVTHPRWSAPIRRYARVATPLVFIVLGAWVLSRGA